MKQIIKREPEFFTNYVQKNRPNEWSELSRYIGKNVRNYILLGVEPNLTGSIEGKSEQNSQCAYSGVSIEPENYSSHIDHFRKQSIFPNLKFEWSNIFISTNNEDYGAKYKDNKFRVKRNDYNYLINPAEDNPSNYFDYSFSGDILIKAKEKSTIEYKKADKTIEVFNLNEKSLVEQRQTVAKLVIDYFEQLSIDEIKANIGRFDGLVESIYNQLKCLKAH